MNTNFNIVDLLVLHGTTPNADLRRRLIQTYAICNVIEAAKKPMSAREILDKCGSKHPSPFLSASTVVLKDGTWMNIWEVTHALRRFIDAGIVEVVGKRTGSFKVDGRELDGEINLYAHKR